MNEDEKAFSSMEEIRLELIERRARRGHGAVD